MARDVPGARVDLGLGDPGPAQQVAGDRGVGATRRLDANAVELDSVDLRRRAPQRDRVLAAGAQ